jgi:hypothetical protein
MLPQAIAAGIIAATTGTAHEGTLIVFSDIIIS